MKLFSKTIEIKILVFTSLFIIGLQGAVFFLFQQGNSGLLLAVLLMLLTVLTLLAGSLIGLICSVSLIFLAGSFLLYFSMNSTVPLVLPLPILMGYGFVILLVVLAAGKLRDYIVNQSRLNRRLQEEISQLVAVDISTGFDNTNRLKLEMELEMKRVKRYGGNFTLILIQMDYFKEFKNLYGEKELLHLLSSIADKIQKVVRKTDRKFRYSADRFALLLTQTDDASIDVVYEKLSQSIKEHQLLNQKYVTLAFRTAYSVYGKQTELLDCDDFLSQMESELVAREL
ncbi:MULTISPECIES: diguanylate cyclase domain-containing protein [unclassified Sporosarcina]|uniref:diguanylate cyclase domain-containing protein n=1 Tax=unclassified Sporosarcina TaxID=2647733 RepID=UPI00204001CF|nr:MULTISPECIES: diguanylate cyclase [unclassified Sporosarcina]GKV66526.1 putative membrane protein YdaK [Sporosarcina sp. NCCP-2331]GLB56803.1 putative membrane protein YdaK [Sporosarcina sp. NCCP-2378]